MSGVTGGSKVSKPKPIQLPAPAPPPPLPAETDSAAMENQRVREQKALLAMKGRQSTILTGSDLGNVSLSKKTALGA